MSEIHHLLLLLTLIYLAECLVWVPPTAVGFRALIPGRWRRQRPFKLSPGWRRGALLSLPWPPLGPLLLCEPLPLVLGPGGVGATAAEGPFFGWSEVREAGASGRQLWVNGELLCTTASVRLCRELEALVRELAGLHVGARERRLKRLLAARHRHDEVRPRLRRHLWAALPLRLWAGGLWLGLFGGLPAILFTDWVRHWLPLVGWMVLSWIGTAVVFFVTLRRHPLLERPLWPDRLHRFLAAASPLSALRAEDLLSPELLADLDPLAPGAALLPRPLLEVRLRQALVERRRAAETAGEGARSEAICWQAGRELAEARSLLGRLGLREAEILAPPEPNDPRSRAYCPRCHAQYLEGEVCTDAACAELPLVPFAPPQRPEKRA